jgi:hypothetical protein
MFTTFYLVVSRLHLVSTTIRAIGKVAGWVFHSNFGLIGLDRFFNHLGF